MLPWQALQSHQTHSYDQAVALSEGLPAVEGNAGMNAAFCYPENR